MAGKSKSHAASHRRPNTRARSQKDVLEEEFEDGDDINIAYYEDFRRHVGEVRAHLAGQYDEDDEEEEEKEDGSGLPRHPLFESHWSTKEKDVFFQALSTSSRLRPDIIAARIKTKSTFEVSIFLKALDEGAVKLKSAKFESDSEGPSEDDDEGEDSADTGPTPKRPYETETQKKARTGLELEEAALQRRAAFPFATEMSNKWVNFEDSLSTVLCELDDNQREAGHIDLRPTPATEEGSEEEPPRTSNLYLVSEQLQILDRIFREAEDVLMAPKAVAGPSNNPLLPDSDSINPPAKSTVASSNKKGDDVDDDETNPRGGNAQENEEEEEEEEAMPRIDLDKMTPAARRRFKNRLYMRKQRAMKRGLAVEQADTTSVRLRPGRKPQKAPIIGEKRKRSAGEEEEGEEGEEGQELDDDDVRAPLPKHGNRNDRIKSELVSALDEKFLKENALGFFNVANLGKMMNIFTSTYRDRLIHGEPAVSSELLLIMRRVVFEFTSELIRRAIFFCITKRSRTPIKILKKSKHSYVTIESIKLALQFMGRRLEDRKTHLGRMLDRLEAQEDPKRLAKPKPKGKQRQGAATAGGKPIRTYPNGLPRETVNRSLYPPFVHLPKEYRPQEKRKRAHDDNIAILHLTKSGYDSSEDGSGPEQGDNDNLVFDDEDEEEVMEGDDPILPLGSSLAEEQEYRRQMEEEDELDAVDMEESMECEQELWDATMGED